MITPTPEEIELLIAWRFSKALMEGRQNASLKLSWHRDRGWKVRLGYGSTLPGGAGQAADGFGATAVEALKCAVAEVLET